MEAPLEMEFLAAALHSLGDPSRLRIVGLLAIRPRYGEELAEILELSAATVSHHLGRLREGRLVRSFKEPPYIRYELEPGALSRLSQFLNAAAQWPESFGLPTEEALMEQTLRAILDEEGRLTSLPHSPRHRTLVLRWLALHFDAGRIYPEREVRRVLLELCSDPDGMRRELVDRGFFQQEGGVFRRMETKVN